MSLVKCPECAKQISDSANMCPSCGFPYREFISQYNFWIKRKKEEREEEKKAEKIKARQEREAQLKKEQDEKKELAEKQRLKTLKCVECGQVIGDVDICPHCGFNMLELRMNQQKKEEERIAKERERIRKAEEYKRQQKDRLVQQAQQKIKEQSLPPKCPKCGSTYIQTSARGINGFWGPIGASKTVNRCSRCGYSWEPRLKR